MNETINAIETEYNGYKFRSRLEARWAVFFDVLDIDYEYESEGYELKDGVKYLPDFYLPECGLFVEVKGTDPTHKEKLKAYYLSSELKRIVLIASGQFGFDKLSHTYYVNKQSHHYFGGEISDIFKYNIFEWFNHSFHEHELFTMLKDKGYIDENERYIDTPEFREYLVKKDKEYYKDKYKKDVHPSWEHGRTSTDMTASEPILCDIIHKTFDEILFATKIAKQSRFEFNDNSNLKKIKSIIIDL